MANVSVNRGLRWGQALQVECAQGRGEEMVPGREEVVRCPESRVHTDSAHSRVTFGDG